MWMGVVPKKLTALLEDIGVSKKEVRGTASEIVQLLETSAMDIWHLTNAIKQKQSQLQYPTPTHAEKVHRLEKSGNLGYDLTRFKSLHIEHQRNIIAKRHKELHGCEDIAVLVPGQKIREYI